jgi:D-alanyl-D-alanine dipeptidase
MHPFSDRLAALQAAMKSRGVDLAVLGATDHMRYLIGWAEPPGERLLALAVPAYGDAVLLVPGLYEDQARGAVSHIPIVSWDDGAGWQGLASEYALSMAAGCRVAVDDELAAGHLLAMQALARQARWESVTPIMTALRGVKSAEEVALMERSAAMADEVFAWIVPQLRVGVSEAEIQGAIQTKFTQLGASSSWAIVCFGPNTALPHHHSGPALLQECDMVVLDLGGCLNGYQSDITRTGCFGTPSPEAARIYEIVYEAHCAALSAARPGVTCESVDGAARDVIVREGYGPRFIHRTGHGIGLSTHEPPNLVQGDTTVLRDGMCFSDEPGIYLPGRFGVRIENIITVTSDGARSLNAPPSPTLPVWSGQRPND